MRGLISRYRAWRARRAGTVLARYYQWTIRTHRRAERKAVSRVILQLIRTGGDSSCR